MLYSLDKLISLRKVSETSVSDSWDSKGYSTIPFGPKGRGGQEEPTIGPRSSCLHFQSHFYIIALFIVVKRFFEVYTPTYG
jgi:hypothetical protein